MTTIGERATVVYAPPPHGFRTFVILWATQSLSFIGNTLTLFAANIWLAQTVFARPEQKPALAFALAATSVAYALPAVFGAPIAGSWVDRHDRKRTMLFADVANGTLCGVLAMLVATGALTLWLLLPLLALYSALGTFHYAAFDTSYAMLVSERLLPRANGMMQTMQNLSFLIAPALAALLIGLPAFARQGVFPGESGTALARLPDGTALALALDGITFFLAASVLRFLVIPSPVNAMHTRAAAQPRHTLRTDVQEGVRYIWRRPPLLWLLATFAVANLTGEVTIILQPLLVKFVLAADWSARAFTYETALALLSTALGAGGVVGGVVITVWGGLKTRRVYGVLLPMLLGALAEVVFGLSSLLYLSATMLFLFVSMGPILNAHSQTIWQTLTPRELQGRVFAVRRLIAQCTLPLAAMLAGVLGGRFSTGIVIASCGGVMALFCVVQLCNPSLRRVEDKVWLEQLAARTVAQPERRSR